jgi:hypothetical protein
VRLLRERRATTQERSECRGSRLLGMMSVMGIFRQLRRLLGGLDYFRLVDDSSANNLATEFFSARRGESVFTTLTALNQNRNNNEGAEAYERS